MTLAAPLSRRLCVAPMLDWTDRHCRFFHRLLAPHAWLYTEMITTGALRFGDAARYLDFSGDEHPLALQLGGSEPDELAECAKLAEKWGYDEVNLNCGCPSERVQRGAFGACLMREPELVADCVRAMTDAVSIPVTVKHRIGLDREDDYGFVRDFVGTVAEAGCQTFIVHARNAVLKGLSPKQNRDVPPLKYETAYVLKRDFPSLEIIVNGGITTIEAIDTHLLKADGVMLGRQAYHDPWILALAEHHLFGEAAEPAQLTRADVEAAMADYASRQLASGAALPAITRHVLGLHRGLSGARHWRRVLSDTRRLLAVEPDQVAEVFAMARDAAAGLPVAA
ncbi:MAG: tRNA dihydrouridine(20/20a) synthase DusA [Janthinobacterium lividum]